MSQQNKKQEEARSHLVAYAMEWLAEWSGPGRDALPPGLPADSGDWLADYRKLLGPESRPDPGTPLLSIFSRVRREEMPDPDPVYWRAARLSLDEPAYPTGKQKARDEAESGLWSGFLEEWETIAKWKPEARFEAFGHLLHKWAWAVPCSYGELGVSLYDEFRALSALVHASGCEQKPAESFLLVGGDIPGIQDFVYTITSKGAAKGLRGRSFFIQLLGDAVVRRLLKDLELPETNVIYAAGGNFMLLAQPDAEMTVAELGRKLDKRMLHEFEGDMAVCLACEPLKPGEVGSGAFADRASRALMEAIAKQKRRRFAELAKKKWKKVFEPKGQGFGDFCSVCQHEQRPGEKRERPEGGGWKCPQCASFEELAQTIAQEGLLLRVDEGPVGDEAKRWQKLLADLSGWSYDFGMGPGSSPSARVYAVNEVRFLRRGARGFRLIANTTPREANGQVRTFEGLADGAQGLKRVGVLRMDVDDLGRVLTQWLPDRTLASSAAMSQTLDRFFIGWLDAICREVMQEPEMAGIKGGRHNLLYTIYAGGDDLFVVGAWDLMPLLAERIENKFALYTGGNPSLRISAGISLEDRKFPLYQAAERAGEALDGGAKELVRWVKEAEGGDGVIVSFTEKEGWNEIRKNAISFLSQATGWESYPFVKDLAEELIRLTTEDNVPRSLLTIMRAIQARFGEDVRRAREQGQPEDKMYFGPWMWQKVYQLARTAQRYDKKETKAVAEAIRRLETEVLTPEQMPFVGLATRWAEYLTRRQEG